MAAEKTNAIRQLERAKIQYTTHIYPHGDGPVDGVTVAELIGEAPQKVFKTLVTKGAKDYFVFVIPVLKELDLKAAARQVGEKAVAMLPVSELLKVTGYVRGGCSPIGMKKAYHTVIDITCQEQQTIIVSAGKIGLQIELSPADLQLLTKASIAALTHV